MEIKNKDELMEKFIEGIFEVLIKRGRENINNEELRKHVEKSTESILITKYPIKITKKEVQYIVESVDKKLQNYLFCKYDINKFRQID